jgi:hypothetical protein
MPKALAALGIFQQALNNISKGSTSLDIEFPILIPAHVRIESMAIRTGLKFSHGRWIRSAV